MNFSDLSFRKKVEYILDYYKWALVLLLAAVLLLVGGIYRQATKKTILLTCAVVNIDLPDDVRGDLTTAYSEGFPGGSRKNTVRLIDGLAVNSDAADGATYEYSYASSMKLMAMMTHKDIDVVIMDEKTYDTFHAQEYLLPLPPAAAASGDGTEDIRAAEAGDAVRLPLSDRMSGTVYAGIVANSKHVDRAADYICYLTR